MKAPFFQNGTANCVYYLRTRDSQEDPHPRAHEFLERVWEECSEFLDLNTRDRAKQDMPSVFWELYLAHVLKRSRIDIIKQARTKKRQRGPDLRSENPDVWIEAVAPGCGVGEDALKSPPLMEAYDVPIDPFVLRLRTSFESKADVFKGYIKDGVVPAAHPTIIAISGCILPTKWSEQPIPRIVRALLATGDLVLQLDRRTAKQVDQYLNYYCQQIEGNTSKDKRLSGPHLLPHQRGSVQLCGLDQRSRRTGCRLHGRTQSFGPQSTSQRMAARREGILDGGL